MVRCIVSVPTEHTNDQTSATLLGHAWLIAVECLTNGVAKFKMDRKRNSSHLHKEQHKFQEFRHWAASSIFGKPRSKPRTNIYLDTYRLYTHILNYGWRVFGDLLPFIYHPSWCVRLIPRLSLGWTLNMFYVHS